MNNQMMARKITWIVRVYDSPKKRWGDNFTVQQDRGKETVHLPLLKKEEEKEFENEDDCVDYVSADSDDESEVVS